MYPQDAGNKTLLIAGCAGLPKRTQRNSCGFCSARGLLLAILAVTSATPAIAAPLQLQPLVTPVSSEHHAGKITFVELVTPDLAAAKQFYAKLFGWTFSDMQHGTTQYSEASLDGRPVAGLIHKEMPLDQRHQPAWLSFIAVRDVDVAKRTALQHGAKVLFEPRNFPDRGREAVFADPQGAVFAVLASSSGDPPDVLASPGEWIWSSLITTDPDKDAAFYQTLFNYEVFDASADENSQHLILATDDYARASVNILPVAHPEAHPHWLNFVRVNDTEKMTAQVVALGGRVIVEPRIDRHGGKLAVVADPAGAAFGLLEWPDTQNKEVAP